VCYVGEDIGEERGNKPGQRDRTSMRESLFGGENRLKEHRTERPGISFSKIPTSKKKHSEQCKKRARGVKPEGIESCAKQGLQVAPNTYTINYLPKGGTRKKDPREVRQSAEPPNVTLLERTSVEKMVKGP